MGKCVGFLLSIFIIALLSLSSCGATSLNKTSSQRTAQSEQLSTLERIQRKNIIRIGTTGDYIPFSYPSATNIDSLQGIDIALSRNLARSFGVELQLVKTTWPTLLDDMHSNKFDIGMSGITITDERKKRFLFSIPLLTSGKVAIARDENSVKYKSIEAINMPNVRVIVNPGGTNELFAREHFPDATLILNVDNLDIFENLVSGKADVMITDAIETLVQEILHPELDAVNPNNPFNTFEIGYLLPNDPVFKKYIDEWINRIQQNGTFERIFDAEIENIE